MISYYNIFGIERVDVTADQVKEAYRLIVQAVHPDHCPGNEAAARLFRMATEARDVLLDPQRKAEYDAFLVVLNAKVAKSGETLGDKASKISAWLRKNPELGGLFKRGIDSFFGGKP